METYQEITQWESTFQPNHIYLLDGDKIMAYVPNGSDTIIWLKTPIRIDKRFRKFIELKGTDSPFVQEEEKDLIHFVLGSKGETYTVNVTKYTCSCPGFTYRGDCKHLKYYPKPND